MVLGKDLYRSAVLSLVEEAEVTAGRSNGSHEGNEMIGQVRRRAPRQFMIAINKGSRPSEFRRELTRYRRCSHLNQLPAKEMFEPLPESSKNGALLTI
jgi:hypothetical protein